MNEHFDPMRPVVAETASSGLPAGQYVGVFRGADLLRAQEGDPMTGKGARKFDSILFRWEIEGGRQATRETPVSFGVKAAYIQVCGFIVGKPLTPGERPDLTQYVGRRYMLTVGNKVDAQGNAKNWTHVVNAMMSER